MEDEVVCMEACHGQVLIAMKSGEIWSARFSDIDQMWRFTLETRGLGK